MRAVRKSQDVLGHFLRHYLARTCRRAAVLHRLEKAKQEIAFLSSLARSGIGLLEF